MSDEPDALPCYDIVWPARQSLPIIVNSPHSGRLYPRELLAETMLPLDVLRQSEDCYVDELLQAAPGLGAVLMKARYARAFVDTNREPGELDPAMFAGGLTLPVRGHSPRVAGGFGVIPRLAGAGRVIYRRKLPAEAAARRLDDYYHPYQRKLSALVDETIDRFGVALLLDCHSMPSSAAGAGGPDFCLGDRFGASCGPEIVEAALDLLRSRGFNAVRNAPYAGAYNVQTYGRPAEGRHALQIEINRALYVDEARLVKKECFGAVAAQMTQLVGHLGRLFPIQVDRAAE